MNIPRLLLIVSYGVYVYSIVFIQAAAHRGERSDWPGQEMMGHVSRGVDPSPYHLVLHEIVCIFSFHY